MYAWGYYRFSIKPGKRYLMSFRGEKAQYSPHVATRFTNRKNNERNFPLTRRVDNGEKSSTAAIPFSIPKKNIDTHTRFLIVQEYSFAFSTPFF